MSNEIKQYTNKKGQKLFGFQAYLGLNVATGKRVQRTRKGFKTKREAQIELARLQYEFEHSSQVSVEFKTFREVFEEWEPEYAVDVTPSTLNRVLGIFRHHVLPVIGEKRMTDLDVRACQNLVDEIAKKVKTYHKCGQYINLVFKYALRFSYIGSNPMESVKYHKVSAEQHKQVWNKQQLQEFLDILDAEYQDQPEKWAFFRLIAGTGARKSELLALELEDVNFEVHSIRIKRTISRGLDNAPIMGKKPKTENSIRTLYFDDKTMQALKTWEATLKKRLLLTGEGQQKGQLLFPNQANEITNPMAPNKWLQKILDDHHLEPRITPHGFRATAATLMGQANMPLKTIQLALGDSSVDVVLNSYMQADEQMKQEAAQQFSAYING